MTPTPDRFPRYDPGQGERRATERYPSGLQESRVLIAGVGEEYRPALVQNISRKGVRLFLTHRFERGTMLSLKIRHLTRTQPLIQLANVVYVEEDGESYALGCEFASECSEDELRAVL